ncbi:unnamed protein product [Lampetra planeri]
MMADSICNSLNVSITQRNGREKAQKASETVSEKLAAAKMKHVSSEGGRPHDWRRGREQEKDNEEEWLQCLSPFSAREPETHEKATERGKASKQPDLLQALKEHRRTNKDLLNIRCCSADNQIRIVRQKKRRSKKADEKKYELITEQETNFNHLQRDEEPVWI